MRILICGIGNPGRQDDGIGASLVERMNRELGSGDDGRGPCADEFLFDANYQLNIEDAENISHFDVVIFADASVDEHDSPFRLRRLEPEPGASFSTHSLSPGGVLALCHEIYSRAPAAYVLAIRGYEWEFDAPMTGTARENVDQASVMLMSALCRRTDGGPGELYSLLNEFVS